MSEEIGYILEVLSFKTSIYRDKSKRNLAFNDDEYYANVLNEYIEQLQQENQQLKEKVNQLETNRDEAIGYIKYCQVSDKDIFPVIEAEKMIEILERGKE